ncbi:MAG: cyclophilin-like fold protein, partial [Draconibacterium sp.]|nr:cyclophilin-like fold protein [Draconibacterium sp.]
MKQIIIETDNLEFVATLQETPTANAIYDALPLKGQAQTWGDEIYFSIHVHTDEEPDAKEEVEIGDLAFWPVGSAFCIFFGPTPVSMGDE